MSRKSSFYKQAIKLCNEKIERETELINKLKTNLANMKAFDNSTLGKSIRQFCKEYTNESFNKELLATIDKMIKIPELNPYEFKIDYDEPCKGEKILYGKKFTTSYKDFGYPDAWFMYYHWNNYDLDEDIEKMQKEIKKAERDIIRAKNRLDGAKRGLAKFKSVLYSANDISNIDEVLDTAESIIIIFPSQGASNTYNTIEIIRKCMAKGVPVTIRHLFLPDQIIDIENTEYEVYDEWGEYMRWMKYDDYEMEFFDIVRYY